MRTLNVHIWVLGGSTPSYLSHAQRTRLLAAQAPGGSRRAAYGLVGAITGFCSCLCCSCQSLHVA